MVRTFCTIHLTSCRDTLLACQQIIIIIYIQHRVCMYIHVQCSTHLREGLFQPVNVWVHSSAEGLPFDLSPYHLRGKVECACMYTSSSRQTKANNKACRLHQLNSCTTTTCIYLSEWTPLQWLQLHCLQGNTIVQGFIQKLLVQYLQTSVY